MPMSMGLFKTEMMGTANWSFNMYPGLSLGAMNTIMQHASDDLKKRYMPPLTEGRWTGTMCLTEPQFGTALGQVKTRSEPPAAGRYPITGPKLVIPAGDPDLSANIPHVLLRRPPDAPARPRGIPQCTSPTNRAHA